MITIEVLMFLLKFLMSGQEYNQILLVVWKLNEVPSLETLVG